MIFTILGQDVRDQDFGRMAIGKLRAALSGYVFGERVFSRAEIIFARACAEFAAVVEDDPLGNSPAPFLSQSLAPLFRRGTTPSSVRCRPA